jgi:hypothetical protein
MRVPHTIVIEPQEQELYEKALAGSKFATIKVLPFSNLGLGSIPARNWIRDDATARGHRRHWVMDDNMWKFRIPRDNKKDEETWAQDGTMFAEMETFVDQYANVAFAGPSNIGDVRTAVKQNAYRWNTRVYSCILMQNDIPFRWRGKYNEDTDICLRALKAGWATVLFNEYLMDKPARDRGKGGNHDELYAGDGNWKMARSLERQHPDVARVIWKYDRWHHKVNYLPFAGNRLMTAASN